MSGTTGRSGGNRTLPPLQTSLTAKPPQKPLGLSDAAGLKWDSLLEQLPVAVLAEIDVHELAILATLLAQSDGLADTLAKNPDDIKSGRLFLQIFDRIHRLSGAFGMKLTTNPTTLMTLTTLLTTVCRRIRQHRYEKPRRLKHRRNCHGKTRPLRDNQKPTIPVQMIMPGSRLDTQVATCLTKSD